MDQKYKRDFLKAGELAREVRSFGKGLLIRGASYNAVIEAINQKIHSLGAKPAFPPQIALNEVAAHFLPEPGTDIIFEDELIKLDIGVSYLGAIGDCAVTVDLSGKYQRIIDAAEAALAKAEGIIQVGLPVREIGRVIDETISSFGLQPVRNLSGHGLGRYRVHTNPMIPNYDDRSSAVIKAGMTFAIEPFATDGKGQIYDAGNPMIFSYVSARPAHSEEAKRLISKIKEFNGLPFAVHDLMPCSKKAIEELLSLGIIVGYAPLVEVAQGMVAQAENSVLVDERGQVFITTR